MKKYTPTTVCEKLIIEQIMIESSYFSSKDTLGFYEMFIIASNYFTPRAKPKWKCSNCIFIHQYKLTGECNHRFLQRTDGKIINTD